MRLSIKAKQIAAVTTIVGLAVVMLSAVHVARLARVVLHESEARGQLLANAIFHRAREVVVTGAGDPYAALRGDPGLRAILESSIYGESVTGASILDTQAGSQPCFRRIRAGRGTARALAAELRIAAVLRRAQHTYDELRLARLPQGHRQPEHHRRQDRRLASRFAVRLSVTE